jgi:hypothetical protein
MHVLIAYQLGLVITLDWCACELYTVWWKAAWTPPARKHHSWPQALRSSSKESSPRRSQLPRFTVAADYEKLIQTMRHRTGCVLPTTWAGIVLYVYSIASVTRSREIVAAAFSKCCTSLFLRISARAVSML